MSEDSKFSNYISTFHYGGPQQPSLEDIKAALDRLKAMAKFYVIGKEVCPSTGAKHLQMYWQFKTKVRRAQVAKILPTYWARQVDDATCEEAATYCMKDGDFDIGGVMDEDSPKDKKRNGQLAGGMVVQCKWKKARMILENGGDMAEIDDQLYVCHWGAIMGIRRANLVMPEELTWEMGQQPNIWMHGKAGCGKSRKAHADFPKAYNKVCNKWWDSYDPEKHEVAIIDDFDKTHAVLCHHLKIWADRYPFIAEIKNGAIGIRPQVIVVTSNWSPEEIWSDPNDLEPIRRRFKIINMSPLDGAFVPATPQVANTCWTTPGTVLGPTGTLPLTQEAEDDMGVVDLSHED